MDQVAAWLATLSVQLTGYAAVMGEEGYETLEDLAAADDAELQEICDAAAMKKPHARKFVAGAQVSSHGTASLCHAPGARLERRPATPRRTRRTPPIGCASPCHARAGERIRASPGE